MLRVIIKRNFFLSFKLITATPTAVKLKIWKKITGTHEENDLDKVRDRARNARQEFQNMVGHYKDLRGEYLQIKANNELEREELKREERMAKSFKFTKMSKKVPFLPSLH